MGSSEERFKGLKVIGIRADNMELQRGVLLLEEIINNYKIELNKKKNQTNNLEEEIKKIKIKFGIINESSINTKEGFIANWMVSQKAYKELAIEYGAEIGLTPQTVMEIALEKKMDVLDCKHDPSHSTNADNNIIKPYVDDLKKQTQSELKIQKELKSLKI